MNRRRFQRPALLASGVVLCFIVALCGLTWQTYREAGQETRNRELMAAIKSDDAASVQALLAQGADANTCDQAEVQHSLWQLLLDRFSHTAHVQANSHSALFVAIEDTIEDNGEIAQALLAHGAKTNVWNADGYTPLAGAAMYGRYDILRVLLNKGVDVNARCRHGMTALMMAAEIGRETSIDILLQHGADVNLKDDNGDNILPGLMEDAPHGDRIVQTLKKAGAK